MELFQWMVRPAMSIDFRAASRRHEDIDGKWRGLGSPRLRRPSWKLLGRTVATVQPWRRLRLYPQVESADCGIACVATVLHHFGREPDIRELRRAASSGQELVAARTLLHMARQEGLQARGVRTEPENLHTLPRPAILHWEHKHYVVLDRVGRRSLSIIDPARGRLKASWDEVDKAFTGVALVFEGDRRKLQGAQSGASPSVGLILTSLRESGILPRLLFYSLVLQLSALAVPLGIRQFLSGLETDFGSRLNWGMVGCSIVAISFAVLALAMARNTCLNRLRVHVDYSLSRRVTDHLLQLPMPFFARHTSGDLLSRLRSTAALRQIISGVAVAAVLDGSLALVLLAVIGYLSRQLGLLMLLIVILQVVVAGYNAGALRARTASLLSRQAASQSRLSQVLNGIESLKAANAEGAAGDMLAGMYSAEADAEWERSRLAGRVEASTTMARISVPIVMTTAGLYGVASGSLTVGTVLAVVLCAVLATPAVGSALTHLTAISALSGYIGRIDDVLEQEAEQAAESRPWCKDTDKLRVEAVSFGYAHEKVILRDVSLAWNSSDLVVLVGPNASGKSTLAKLLAGIYEPSSGHIYLGAESCNAATLRGYCGYMPQFPYFFSGTIRDNLCFFRDFDEAEVCAVLSASGADEIVARKPRGLDSLVHEGGANLSGGERQLLAFARTLLKRPRFLVLDEATSALDSRRESEMFRVIRGLGLPALVVTHSRDLYAEADAIYATTPAGSLEKLSRTK